MAKKSGRRILTPHVKTAIIVNPTSGRIKYPAQAKLINTRLSEGGFNPQLAITTRPLEAISLARQAAGEGADLIIAVGGDGTINEVINGMTGSSATLGIIPSGLSNVLARELGIPVKLPDALAVIESGHTRWIDLGTANNRFFALMAGVGLDAEAVRTVNSTTKKLLRRYAFHLAGIRSLFRFKSTVFRVIVDGVNEKRGYAAIISNAHYYGGPHQINSEARLDDGLLHLCLFLKGGKGAYVRYFWEILRKQLQRSRKVYFCRAEQILIPEDGLPVHVDGDFIGYTPLQVGIQPGALQVLSPVSEPSAAPLE